MTKSDNQSPSEQQIEELITRLFTNGSGHRATRLLLVNDPPNGRYVQLTEPQRNLGGYCEAAVRDLLGAFAAADTRAVSPSRDAVAKAAAEEIVTDHLAPCAECFGDAMPDVRQAIEAIISRQLERADRTAVINEVIEKVKAVNPNLTFGSANGSMMKKCILSELEWMRDNSMNTPERHEFIQSPVMDGPTSVDGVQVCSLEVNGTPCGQPRSAEVHTVDVDAEGKEQG